MFYQIQKRNFFTIVTKNEAAYRWTRGQSPAKLDSGLRLAIPLYHKIKSADLREQTLPIYNVATFTHDNIPVLVNGNLSYKVKNPNDALFKIQDYQQSLSRVGTSAIRDFIGNTDYNAMVADKSVMNKDLQKVMDHSMQRWGIGCTRFQIHDIKRVPQEFIQNMIEKTHQKELGTTLVLYTVFSLLVTFIYVIGFSVLFALFS